MYFKFAVGVKYLRTCLDLAIVMLKLFTFRHYLTRRIGFEAVMRTRCAKGLFFEHSINNLLMRFEVFRESLLALFIFKMPNSILKRHFNALLKI